MSQGQLGELSVGIRTNQPGGVVTIATPNGTEMHLGWADALSLAAALIRSAGSASVYAGATREDYCAALIARIEGPILP